MFEYGSYGDGAKYNKTRRILSEEQVKEYTKEAYLKDWDTNKMLNELSTFKNNA